MPERRFGVGLIVPSSNTVMEPDFHRAMAGFATVSTTRIFLESVTRDAESDMVRNELPRVTRLIRTAAPDVIVFGCTSAGSYNDELSHSVANCIDDAGFVVVECRGMGIVSNRDIGRVTPDQIASFVLAENIEADCLFLSCTN